jgi:hypothetical protein
MLSPSLKNWSVKNLADLDAEIWIKFSDNQDVRGLCTLATLVRCHLIYSRDRRENSQETNSRTLNGPAINFNGENETLSSESPKN